MKRILLISTLFGLTYSTNSISAVLKLEEFALLTSSEDFTQQYIQDSHVFFPFNDFSTQGLSLETVDEIGSNNLGTFTWKVTNNSGQTFSDMTSVVFLDASIDEQENTYFNERAEFVGNTDANSWEIDEPGRIFGDIYQNAIFGDLENSNAYAPDTEEDISFALGFELDDFETGDWFELTFEISESNIGGLHHYDLDSDFGFYFNAYFSTFKGDDGTVSVPEPTTLGLLAIGILGLWQQRKKMVS